MQSIVSGFPLFLCVGAVLGIRPQPRVVTASLKWVGLVPTGMPSLCKIYTRFPRLRAKKGGKLARYLFLIFIMMK